MGPRRESLDIVQGMAPPSEKTPELVEIARFPSRLEAESIGHALDQYDIPFMVRSDDVGMYGPGMTGWSPQGASLWVAARHVERVRELLTCIVRPLEESDDFEGADDDDGDDGEAGEVHSPEAP